MHWDIFVPDDACACVLEGFAASDVIVMMMAVDQILDRLVGHLLDLVDVVLTAGRTSVSDRVGGDHAVLGDDEHRLMSTVTEDIDIVGAIDLGGLDLRPLRLLRLRRIRERNKGHSRKHGCYESHVSPPS